METIYCNGDIITMEQNRYAESVFVKDGIIKCVGNYSDIIKFKTHNTELVNLDKKTMLPAFIDAHSHITAVASSLRCVPLNAALNFDDIIKKLIDFKKERNLNDDEWIVGFGYDNNFLKEKKHPTKEVLDKIPNPVLISHTSGHMGVVNSLGLKKLNITSKTQNPDGGIIGRVDNTDEPNGYLEENAFMNYSKSFNNPSDDEMCNLIKEAQQIYLKNGITTIQDGLTKDKDFKALKLVSNKNLLIADIVSYIDLNNFKYILDENKNYLGKYNNKYKIGGYKIFLDGSPQGRTAWMTKPYENDNYCGYPTYETKKVVEFIKTALTENVQIIAHCNGDAAADQYLKAYKIALEETRSKNNLRPVMIHAQFLRHDQLDDLKSINMIPSYFIAHTYYWGDIHIKNFGKQRAFHISPAKATVEKNLIYTFHQDTPVIAPNMLETIWCAVNRITKEGVVLGEDERIDVYDALKAVTINSAYQYFEENQKGSIKENKKADFVVLDQNPLKVDSMSIKDIKVLQTIKNGVNIEI